MNMGLMHEIKEHCRESRPLARAWGKVRWYTSGSGIKQVTSQAAYAARNLGHHTIECPICGWYGHTFLSTGTISRPNARCPRCASLERHRLLQMYLQNEWSKRLELPASVLEIAPGSYSFWMFGKFPAAHYVTTDLLSPEAMTRSNVTSLPFQSVSFDLIVCYHVLMYVPDDRMAMSEFYRVLKHGGTLLSSENVKSTEPERLASNLELSEDQYAKQFDRAYRIYGTALVDRLIEAGFDVEANFYAQKLSFGTQQRHRLLADDVIYVCKKA